MRRTFVFDQEKCMACNTCTVSCKDWNQVNPGPVRWRKQFTHESDETPFFHPLAMSCNHCALPACASVCAAGAIKKRSSDGVVYVDRNLCQSFKSCIAACPFAVPQIADEIQEPTRYQGWVVDHPMQKCDFCMERIDKGQDPVCVASCPAHALEAGDYEYLIQKYQAKSVTLEPISRSKYLYAYANDNDGTNPSFLIKKRGGLTITKAVIS